MMKNKDFKNMIIVLCLIVCVAGVIEIFLGGIAAGILFIVFGISLVAVFSAFTLRRYSDIESLNGYLVKVLSGEEMPDVSDQEEGELSILKSNIYKTTTQLYYQKEVISKDKIRLAEALADISHQLKTPLTSLMVMNDLLKTEDDSAKQKEFLNTQSAQLDRMNWLIQTLLKLSKIDAGSVKMKQERTMINSLISEAMRPFEVLIDIKNVRYIYSSSDVSILCDKNWTVEALQNIIKNCIEHMDNDGALTISTEETSIFTQIIISDTGSGIAKEDVPHIFERFYKGKNSGKDSVGIGLPLAKSILASQHGDILVESKEGEGTTFYVRFYKTII